MYVSGYKMERVSKKLIIRRMLNVYLAYRKEMTNLEIERIRGAGYLEALLQLVGVIDLEKNAELPMKDIIVPGFFRNTTRKESYTEVIFRMTREYLEGENVL